MLYTNGGVLLETPGGLLADDENCCCGEAPPDPCSACCIEWIDATIPTFSNLVASCCAAIPATTYRLLRIGQEVIGSSTCCVYELTEGFEAGGCDISSIRVEICPKTGGGWTVRLHIHGVDPYLTIATFSFDDLTETNWEDAIGPFTSVMGVSDWCNILGTATLEFGPALP